MVPIHSEFETNLEEFHVFKFIFTPVPQTTTTTNCATRATRAMVATEDDRNEDNRNNKDDRNDRNGGMFFFSVFFYFTNVYIYIQTTHQFNTRLRSPITLQGIPKTISRFYSIAVTVWWAYVIR